MHRWFARTAAFAVLSAAAMAAKADILIGQTAGFTGPAAGSVKELSLGAALYIADTNRRGGVDGQPIRLIQLDDGFDPARAASNAQKLVVDHGVLALFASRGTPHTQAIGPLLARFRIAMIAPSTGAMLLRSPVNPYIFNVRAAYQREAEHAIEHLGTIGLARIAVLYVDDSFGADGLAGAEKGFAAIHEAPGVLERIGRDKPDFSAIVPKIVKHDAQAVLIIGSATAVVQGTAAIRAAGSHAQIVTLSNNASDAFVKAMGPNAYGTIVSQVFPSERSLDTPVAKEASDLAAAKGLALSPSMMEGFVAAKVLVEGLRRAGPAPTRDKVIAALNGMSRFDLGGMVLSYSPANHSGLDYVDLSIIGPKGQFTR